MLNGCQKEDQHDLVSKDNSTSLISHFESSIISGELEKFKDKNIFPLKSSSTEQVEFDSKNLLVSSLEISNNHAIIMHEVGYDKDNLDNYSMVFLENNYQITKGFIVKEEKLLNNRTRVNYLSLDYELLFEVEVNFNTNTSTVISSGGISKVKKTWGQRTMDCISDVYSNHGWISVWAGIQTAFIPETAAFLAAYCAGHELMEVSEPIERQLLEDDRTTGEKIPNDDFIKQMEKIYNNK